MTQPVLIGTYGWEHDAWVPAFYPPELPSDWRFCFFSNRIRSVIVPASAWSRIGPGSAGQWAEDSDPAFRFVLELPAGLALHPDPVAAVETFFAPLAPLRELTAALLLPLVPAPSIARLEALLAQLVARHPLCVRVDDACNDTVRDCLRAHPVSLCWLPEHQPAPEPQGDFLLALTQSGEPRFVRGVLEALARWQEGSRGAGLFFTPAGTGPALAEQARTLAEIMGV